MKLIQKLNVIKRYIDEYRCLREFFFQVRQTLESKKVELLSVNSQQLYKRKEEELVSQINVLAELLNDVKVNIEDIPGTLRAYPNLIKK